MSIRSILEGLVRADVEFVIVGMAAGQLHGSRLLTEDVDIVYRRACENISKLATYLRQIDARVLELWPNEGFASDFSEGALVAEASLSLATSEGEIDVLHRIDGVGEYDDVLQASQSLSIGTISVSIITIDGLIASKRAAGRPKDRLHLPDLEYLRELKRRAPKRTEQPEL